MTSEELGRLYPVEMCSYQPAWVEWFASEKRLLAALLGPDYTGRIEHIGSTAVPGLAAKPTVDMLLERPCHINTDALKKRLTAHGYIYMTEQTRHLMFVKGYTDRGLTEPSYHLHVGPLDQAWLWDRVYFRDYLRAHPREAERYAALKRSLAERYRHDREAYTDAKENYVKRVTARGRRETKRDRAHRDRLRE